MNPRTRGFALVAGLITGLAAVFVAVAAAVQALRQGSWGPVLEVGWIPAVIAGTWPASGRRCLTRRGPAS